MRLKNSLTPYPILNNYNDDYVDSSFEVDYDVITQFSMISGNLRFNLQNEDIQKLIETGKAQYCVHLENASACYRKIITSFENKVSFHIPANELTDKLEIQTFVILTEDVEYTSEKLHPDYSGQTFHLFANDIIAVGTAMNFTIQRDDKDLDSLPSIIRIMKMDNNEQGTMKVITDNSDYIIIGLCKEAYELYANLGKMIYKDTILSLVLFPALVIVLQRMYTHQTEESEYEKHWFRVIKSKLEENGYTLNVLDPDSDKLLQVCQKIFADPIMRSFEELQKRAERV